MGVRATGSGCDPDARRTGSHVATASPASWAFDLPEAATSGTGEVGPPYGQGLAVTVDDTPTDPLQGTLRLRWSLADGSSLTFVARDLRANLTHIQRAVAVTVTDRGSGDLLFSGHVLRAKVTPSAGAGTLVDVVVEAVGLEQRIYDYLLESDDARAINTAATVAAQLARLVTVAGSAYSSGSIHANVNRLDGVGPGSAVGVLLRGMGDAQRITPGRRDRPV